MYRKKLNKLTMIQYCKISNYPEIYICLIAKTKGSKFYLFSRGF